MNNSGNFVIEQDTTGSNYLIYNSDQWYYKGFINPQSIGEDVTNYLDMIKEATKYYKKDNESNPKITSDFEFDFNCTQNYFVINFEMKFDFMVVKKCIKIELNKYIRTPDECIENQSKTINELKKIIDTQQTQIKKLNKKIEGFEEQYDKFAKSTHKSLGEIVKAINTVAGRTILCVKDTDEKIDVNTDVNKDTNSGFSALSDFDTYLKKIINEKDKMSSTDNNNLPSKINIPSNQTGSAGPPSFTNNSINSSKNTLTNSFGSQQPDNTKTNLTSTLSNSTETPSFGRSGGIGGFGGFGYNSTNIPKYEPTNINSTNLPATFRFGYDGSN